MSKTIKIERVVQNGVRCQGTGCEDSATVRVQWRTLAMPAPAFDYWCPVCWEKIRAALPRKSAVAYAVVKP